MLSRSAGAKPCCHRTHAPALPCPCATVPTHHRPHCVRAPLRASAAAASCAATPPMHPTAVRPMRRREDACSPACSIVVAAPPSCRAPTDAQPPPPDAPDAQLPSCASRPPRMTAALYYFRTTRSRCNRRRLMRRSHNCSHLFHARRVHEAKPPPLYGGARGNPSALPVLCPARLGLSGP